MRVLALDTSTPHTSCALLEDDRVVRERSFEPPAKAGDVLPAALGDLDGIDAVAVGLGPGSFTGLRVGLAAAKAIAYARKLPIAGASSLQAIAAGERGLVYAATEARKGELFVQAFRDGVPQAPAQVVLAADLRLPEGARLVRAPPRASYDASACFSLAPDYVQGFPARGG
ncbi:MAG: tRNA (adenosine(37)-N6)-threonylcarbamoyltransferase complex dimerization subunit type 1 TsaB [Deltaproteobacteria bacterium 13_1_40CM_3_69_14]|nr:MAG: tRNA (adenosine(37)-N6)-threonylcarbamoyltransferase complex dimerization subunit type 1 TsaB [Deltaproteobacteria bacterium 13_1_40CM_3_69_14]